MFRGTGKTVPLLLRQKISPAACAAGLSAFIVLFFLNEKLCDLYRVSCSTLADLVSAAPEVDAVLIHEVAAYPAYIYSVLVGCQDRHRIDLFGWLVIKSASRSILNSSSDNCQIKLLFRYNVDRYSVGSLYRDSDACAADLEFRQMHDLASFILQLHLLG